ncbi:MAG: glycosyltransferase [Chloroflexi bacterium]|nr:glycosyltransferase [Chloroflexota bacterium]
MKLMYIVQHLTLGGAEELLLGIVTHLPRDRFDVVVGCLTREGIVAREMRAAGVRVEVIPGRFGPRDPSAFLRLLRFIRSERPRIVHTCLRTAGLYGRLAAWLSRTPVIYHAEQNVYAERAARHRWLERWLAAHTTRIVACCQAVADHYASSVGPGPGRLCVLLNAVDFTHAEPMSDRQAARELLGFKPNELVLGTLGRLERQKGLDVLLEAVAMLAPSRASLRLFVAGQGCLTNELKKQAEALGIADRVRFLGVRRDRDVLFGAMDVFVLPSRWEGLSLALAEAAGAGLPIVATRVGGNEEVVEDGKTALLVPPEDAEALADAIASLSDDAALRARLARGARSDARSRYAIERYVAKLVESYDAALSAAG